jgi:uncharacterized protein YuzE
MADLKLREESSSKNKRKLRRYNTNLKAKFVSKESLRGGEECIIIDFSQKGMGVQVFLIEDTIIGSNVILEVFTPGELKPIIVKGTIQWSKKIENGYVSGIELSKELDEINLSKLHLCTKRNKIGKEDKLKIQVISKGHTLTPKTPKDRYIP